jgi:hypothetical protein
MHLVAAAAVVSKPIAGVQVDQRGRATLVELVASLPANSYETSNDVNSWAAYCAADQSVYGNDTSTIQVDTGSTKQNDAAKTAAVQRFFRTLQTHPQLKALVELMVCPDNPPTKVLRFFLLLRGTKTAEKKTCLNGCMCVWVLQFCKDGYAPDDPQGAYEPNYVDKHCRQLFKVFGDGGILFKHSEMRGMAGSYYAIAKRRFHVVSQARPTFGRTPHRASVEHNDVEKIKNEANPPYDTNNYDDLRDLAMYKCAKENMKRASCEVCSSCQIISLFPLISRFPLFIRIDYRLEDEPH